MLSANINGSLCGLMQMEFEEQDVLWLRRATWTYCRPLVPHQCVISNRWLWCNKPHFKLIWVYVSSVVQIGWLHQEVGTMFILSNDT